MSVSVLTLNKNRHTHLENLVHSLYKSDVKPAELVIIEMSDESQLPADLVAMAPFRIVIVPFATEGLPLSQARNLAAQTAKSEKLLFLDVDCIAGHKLVSVISQTVAGDDMLISPKVYYLPPGIDLSAWRMGDIGAEYSFTQLGNLHEARHFPRYGLRLESNPGLFWSLAFGLTQKAFQKLGGFCEEYEGYGAEDTDFGFRANAAGFKHYLSGDCRVFHQYHQSYDPPFNHFISIIKNARRFYAYWGQWPMQGWLKAFADYGLIEWHNENDKLNILRIPEEITAHS